MFPRVVDGRSVNLTVGIKFDNRLVAFASVEYKPVQVNSKAV